MSNHTMIHPGVNISLQELIALQRLALGLDLTQQRNIRSQLLGGHLSVMRGRGMEFSEVRSYHTGDDIRHMQWRITARTGKPHVKLFREERERPVFFIVDFNPSMFFGTRVAFKSVIAARIAALLAWAAAQHGDRVGGLLFAGQHHLELKPLARKRGVLPLLKGLSDFSQLQPAAGKTCTLSDACLKLKSVAKPGALTIIISDFNSLDSSASDHLSRLGTQQQLMACYIRDPLEIAPPPPQSYMISDGTQASRLDLRNPQLREHYQQHFDQRHQTRLTLLQHAKIPLINVITTDNLICKLQEFFHTHHAGIV